MQGTKHMHYYLQLSEGDPTTDPGPYMTHDLTMAAMPTLY